MEKKSDRSETVDLNDNTLQVDISDALSEREKVKFTVHTKVGFLFLNYLNSFINLIQFPDLTEGVCQVRFFCCPAA